MRIVPLITLVCVALLACQKENENERAALPDGKYIGTFSRTGMDTSQVVMEILSNRFSGSSSIQQYPAICGGYYEINGNTVSFSDTCTWTANFDWSLITDGNFEYSTNDTIVTLRRTHDQVTDEYRLRRLVR